MFCASLSTNAPCTDGQAEVGDVEGDDDHADGKYT